MLRYLIYGMIYLGSGLMVYNIYGFIRFARTIRGREYRGKSNLILYIPILLLVLFLLGYLAVGVFGDPDLIVSGILFGGSLFVFVIYLLLDRITRRIIENGQIESRLMAAQESNRAKIAFLSTVSHEMRTPMNIILGMDAVALSEPCLPSKTREYLEKIDLSARHLLGLINNILDMNSIQSGSLEVKEREFDLEDTLRQISLIASSLCEDKGLTFTYVAPEEAPCCMGDETMLKRVLISILDNAVKYTDSPGEVDLRVEADGEKDAVPLFRFEVTDTGVGIDSEFLPRLFNAFSQEDASSTNRYGGSGLSLAMAKEMVELMGGAVEVTSEKGVGSTFTVTLPLKTVDPSAKETAADPDTDLAGRRVLIVEDLPDNAEIVADLLELEDMETERAENGKIALDMFSASPPGYYDAILMDLRMPVMDGLTAAREIRKLPRPDAGTVPIIALTANTLQSDLQSTAEAGMNAHLAKPTDADTLYAVLRRYIRG